MTHTIKHRWSSQIALAFFLAFTLLPLGLGLGYALLYSLGLRGVLSEGFTLVHWQETLSSRETWRSFAYSFYLTLASLLPPTLAALVVSARYPHYFRRGLFSYLIYFPLALPAVVVAFFMFQMLSQSGLLARLVFHLGCLPAREQFPGLVNDAGGLGIILAHWLMAMPFLTVLFLGMYDSEQLDDLSQVSATLGAGRGQIYRRVVFPVLWRKAFPTVVLYGMFLFGAYEIPLLLGRQSPQMISVLVARKVGQYNLVEIPEAYALAVLYTAFVSL
ncbi:MAG: ABC transporter permease subunit [Bacteroidia bacterium]|nr:ABC transporter permease subunit [Bacteroidia bacterium]